MVKLSKKAIQDFKTLVRQKRGLDLTDQEAQKLALEWLEFFKLVYRPIEEK